MGPRGAAAGAPVLLWGDLVQLRGIPGAAMAVPGTAVGKPSAAVGRRKGKTINLSYTFYLTLNYLQGKRCMTSFAAPQKIPYI